MASPTLGGNSLGNVGSMSWTKDGNITPLPFPGGDAADTEVFDMLGVTRIITVNGDFTGTNTAAVKTQVDIIQALIDGDQSTTLSFASDELGDGVGGAGSVTVMIASFDITWNVPGFSATYVLKLIEGNAI